MSIFKTSVGVIAIAAITVGAGCSSEVSQGDRGSDDVAAFAASDVDNVEATATYQDCSLYNSTSRMQATNLVRYVFGNDSFAPSSSSAVCVNLKAGLDDLRSKIKNPMVLMQPMQGWACNDPIPATFFQLNSLNPMMVTFSSAVSAIRTNMDACSGEGTLTAFLAAGDAYSVLLDPEPATLTANLAAASGATAAAYYTATPTVATRVVYRSGAAAACGTLLGGEPCSTTALAVGSQTKQMILKNGTICTCR